MCKEGDENADSCYLETNNGNNVIMAHAQTNSSKSMIPQMIPSHQEINTS